MHVYTWCGLACKKGWSEKCTMNSTKMHDLWQRPWNGLNNEILMNDTNLCRLDSIDHQVYNHAGRYPHRASNPHSLLHVHDMYIAGTDPRRSSVDRCYIVSHSPHILRQVKVRVNTGQTQVKTRLKYKPKKDQKKWYSFFNGQTLTLKKIQHWNKKSILKMKNSSERNLLRWLTVSTFMTASS